jgi:hypothetical protein
VIMARTMELPGRCTSPDGLRPSIATATLNRWKTKRPKSSRLRALHFLVAGEGFARSLRLRRPLRRVASPATPDLRVMSTDRRVGVSPMFLGCCGVRREKCLCWMGLVCANPPQWSPHTNWCNHRRRGCRLMGGESNPPLSASTVQPGPGSEGFYDTVCDLPVPLRLPGAGQSYVHADVSFHRCLRPLGIVDSATRGCPMRPGGTNRRALGDLRHCPQAP